MKQSTAEAYRIVSNRYWSHYWYNKNYDFQDDRGIGGGEKVFEECNDMK